MYILVPFIFFIWGSLILAYFKFNFRPEWLADILNVTSANDNPYNAFILSEQGGLLVICVGIVCLLWIIFVVPRLHSKQHAYDPSSDDTTLHSEISGLFSDLLEILPAFLLIFGNGGDGSDDSSESKTLSRHEAVCDSDGNYIRVLEYRLNGEIRLENEDIVHTSDGHNFYGSNDSKYTNWS